MLGLVISSSHQRFERAKVEIGKCGFYPIVMLPHITKTDKRCNSTEDNIKLAHRNAWSLVASLNKTVAIFEDDVVLFEPNKCIAAARNMDRHTDVLFLGEYPVFWALHAIVWTPRAANYMLDRSRACERSRGKGVDLHLRNACFKKNLRCELANAESRANYVGEDILFRIG